jgi:hypothetical protein
LFFLKHSGNFYPYFAVLASAIVDAAPKLSRFKNATPHRFPGLASRGAEGGDFGASARGDTVATMCATMLLILHDCVGVAENGEKIETF